MCFSEAKFDGITAHSFILFMLPNTLVETLLIEFWQLQKQWENIIVEHALVTLICWRIKGSIGLKHQQETETWVMAFEKASYVLQRWDIPSQMMAVGNNNYHLLDEVGIVIDAFLHFFKRRKVIFLKFHAKVRCKVDHDKLYLWVRTQADICGFFEICSLTWMTLSDRCQQERVLKLNGVCSFFMKAMKLNVELNVDYSREPLTKFPLRLNNHRAAMKKNSSAWIHNTCQLWMEHSFWKKISNVSYR